MLEEILDSEGDLRRLARVEEKAVPSVIDDLRQAAGPDGQDGNAGGHGFEGDAAERFDDRGNDDGPGQPEEVGEVGPVSGER